MLPCCLCYLYSIFSVEGDIKTDEEAESFLSGIKASKTLKAVVYSAVLLVLLLHQICVQSKVVLMTATVDLMYREQPLRHFVLNGSAISWSKARNLYILIYMVC